MNTDRVVSIIRLEGLEARGGFCTVGPTITVRIPRTNNAIVGLIPIDDESDDRFAEYMISEAKKLIKPVRGGDKDG